MIFSISDHIKQIIKGTKTQTRRKSSTYLVGKTYSLQLGRTKPGIPEGRIEITEKRLETYLDGFISESDALAEGGYTSGQFETVFKRMYPDWDKRYAYTFKFIPSKKEK